MTGRRPERPRRRPAAHERRRELLESLVDGRALDAAVPAALDILEREPLAAAACFPGDLLRGLMQLPRRYWVPNGGLHARYLAVVRAAAAARRRLPPEQRMAFWEALDPDAVRRTAGAGR
jgi:hypothetical protein